MSWGSSYKSKSCGSSKLSYSLIVKIVKFIHFQSQGFHLLICLILVAMHFPQDSYGFGFKCRRRRTSCWCDTTGRHWRHLLLRGRAMHAHNHLSWFFWWTLGAEPDLGAGALPFPLTSEGLRFSLWLVSMVALSWAVARSFCCNFVNMASAIAQVISERMCTKQFVQNVIEIADIFWSAIGRSVKMPRQLMPE